MTDRTMPSLGGFRETSPEWGAARGPLVYYLFDVHGVLIYIGRTYDDLYMRFRGHQDKQWHAWAARPFATRAEAHAFELAEIDRHRPPLNVAGTPAGRAAHLAACRQRAIERREHEAATAHLWADFTSEELDGAEQ